MILLSRNKEEDAEVKWDSGATKNSQVWKSAENIEMITQLRQGVFYTYPEIILLINHSDLNTYMKQNGTSENETMT